MFQNHSKRKSAACHCALVVTLHLIVSAGIALCLCRRGSCRCESEECHNKQEEEPKIKQSQNPARKKKAKGSIRPTRPTHRTSVPSTPRPPEHDGIVTAEGKIEDLNPETPEHPNA